MLEPAQAAVLAHVEKPAVLLDARREGRTAGRAQVRGVRYAVCGVRCAVCGVRCACMRGAVCVHAWCAGAAYEGSRQFDLEMLRSEIMASQSVHQSITKWRQKVLVKSLQPAPSPSSAKHVSNPE